MLVIWGRNHSVNVQKALWCCEEMAVPYRRVESSRLKTAEALGIVDAHLESRPFLAGDALTMGDIPLGCSVWRWMALPIERPALPNVQRWFDALTARPAYGKIVMLPLT